jgi:hypothetical protein
MKKLLLSSLIIVGLLVCLLALVIASRTPDAVTVNIIGHSTNAVGAPTVVFQVTNRSRSSVVITYGTQITTNLPFKWYPAKSQMEDFKFRQPLPPKSSLNFEFATPAEGPPWRACVIYSWPPDSFHARINDYLKKFNLSKRTIALTPEIDN